MKFVWMTLLFAFVVTPLMGDVVVSLDGSGSSDPDGYISDYEWMKWNGEDLDHIGTVSFDPCVPGVYQQKDPNGVLIATHDKAIFKISLPVGIHYFALIVRDNDGAVSAISPFNANDNDPHNEWTTVTVLSQRAPYILAFKSRGIQSVEQINRAIFRQMLRWSRKYLEKSMIG